MVCNFGLLSILPFDEDEDSGSDEEGDSDESEGEFGASKTRSGKGYQNDDDDDDDPYIPQPLSKAPPWQRSDKHPSKVIDVEEADDAPKEGIQLERWGELPEIQESEGDDQSIDSLEVSEPDIDVPKAPTPQPAPSPALAASRPTRDRHPPDFLSPKMSGQYHGGEMTFTCDIYLVEIADNVSAFFDDMAFLLTLADKDTMTLKDALNEPDAEEFVKAMIKEVNDHVTREHWIIVSVKSFPQTRLAPKSTLPLSAVTSRSSKRIDQPQPAAAE